MSEKKKGISKLCLTGFILSILSALLVFFYFRFTWVLASIPYVSLILVAAIVLFPLVGLVLSIAGLATAGKRGKTGKGFGIAGIILPNVYAVSVVGIIVLFGFLMVSGTTSQREMEEHSDVRSMGGGIGYATNTEFDVSQYKIPKGYKLNSSETPVSESELKIYAKSKLQEIKDESDLRIKGKYQDYNFLIIRRDRFDEWEASDRLVSISWDWNDEGYAKAHYSVMVGFSRFASCTLHMYKDPSDKYIIITNCYDYKIIKEFFD